MAALSLSPHFLTQTLACSLPRTLPSLFSTTEISPSTSPPRPSRIPCLFSSSGRGITRRNRLPSTTVTASAINNSNYEFYDGSTEVELKLQVEDRNILGSRDMFVNVDESSISVKVNYSGSLTTLFETNNLYATIKPAETIWYLDDDQLVVNLKKHDPDIRWPDIIESWEALSAGAAQYFKGASIYVVGDSTEVNERVAKELAIGLGYTHLNTKELLETLTKQTMDSWLAAEESSSLADAENAIIENLSSHVRTVVATLGVQYGAAGKCDCWRHLHAGFTVWLSESGPTDGNSTKKEARGQIYDGFSTYSKADVVVKLGVWDTRHAKSVAQASLSALKKLIMADKELTGKKSLYMRLGCRGDWPNIKEPGWGPSSPNKSLLPSSSSTC